MMGVRAARPLLLLVAATLAVVAGAVLSSPRPAGSQAADVLLNVIASGSKKRIRRAMQNA